MTVTPCIPVPWGPLATRVGLLPPGWLGATAKDVSQPLSAALSSCLEQKNPKEPQHGGVDASVNGEEEESDSCGRARALYQSSCGF